jgi:hypothetical protein
LQSGLIRRLATAAITLTLLSFPAAAQQGALLDVPLASGSERVWFVGPTNPRAALIMFVGSAGVVEFGANGVTGYEADNFLVRTQPLWLAQGFAVAILGSPNNGALSGHRHELAYADAIGRAVDFVRTRANAPVWLLGISQGAIAVANGAAHLPGKVTGVVLISPVAGRSSSGETVFDGDLGAIAVPALVIANQNDGCAASAPGFAPQIVAALARAPRKDLIVVQSSQSREAACETLTPHGFLGIESEVAQRISNWISAAPGR